MNVVKNPNVLSVAQVLFKKPGHLTGILYTTGKHYMDFPVPTEGDFVVEVRARSEGGDGPISRVRISGDSACSIAPSGALSLPALPLSHVLLSMFIAGGVLSAQPFSLALLLVVALCCLGFQM